MGSVRQVCLRTLCKSHTKVQSKVCENTGRKQVSENMGRSRSVRTWEGAGLITREGRVTETGGDQDLGDWFDSRCAV